MWRQQCAGTSYCWKITSLSEIWHTSCNNPFKDISAIIHCFFVHRCMKTTSVFEVLIQQLIPSCREKCLLPFNNHLSVMPFFALTFVCCYTQYQGPQSQYHTAQLYCSLSCYVSVCQLLVSLAFLVSSSTVTAMMTFPVVVMTRFWLAVAWRHVLLACRTAVLT